MSHTFSKKNDGFTLKNKLFPQRKGSHLTALQKTKNQLSNDIHTINKKIL
jgi:hypothetical protein